ncbi:MAG: hypothetical protein QOF13_1483 [Solirubrobacterales bacterium]|jgi:hypothetical protein|nr:hypothetical protein [Solirubrobacterales bacterium]
MTRPKRHEIHRRLLAAVCATGIALVTATGCGSERQVNNRSMEREVLTSSKVTADRDRAASSVKPWRWGIVAVRSRSVRLGVVVPFCGYREREPFIDRVERREASTGLTVTVFVRFSPEGRQPGGCVGESLTLMKWLRLGRKARSGRVLFDGSTSPPSPRQFPAA